MELPSWKDAEESVKASKKWDSMLVDSWESDVGRIRVRYELKNK